MANKRCPTDPLKCKYESSTGPIKPIFCIADDGLFNKCNKKHC